jgi:hypothetical protein
MLTLLDVSSNTNKAYEIKCLSRSTFSDIMRKGVDYRAILRFEGKFIDFTKASMNECQP